MIEISTGGKIYALCGLMEAMGPTVTIAGGWYDNFGAMETGVCVRAYQPKGAANYAASKTDLTGNQDASEGAAPEWDAVNGWVLNGSSHWLDTGFVPNTDQDQAVFVQYTGVPAGAASNMMTGVRTGGGDLFLAPNYTGSTVGYGNGGAGVFVGPGLLAGNIGLAQDKGYRNGSAEGGSIGAWGAGGAYSIYIGCWNQQGAAARFLACNIQAYAIYDPAPTAPEIAALVTYMAAI